MRDASRDERPLTVGERCVWASILLYALWLLPPAVQAFTGVRTGALCCALFFAGVLLDRPFLRANAGWFALKCLAAVTMSLFLYGVLKRGGEFLPFLVQSTMFWAPFLMAFYVCEKRDARLLRGFLPLVLALSAITCATTLIGLAQTPIASRRLGDGSIPHDVLRGFMLRNIGGYDFIYGLICALPVLAGLAFRARGLRRAMYLALYALAAATIVASQYLNALILLAVVTGLLLCALLIGCVARLFGKRPKVGACVLGALPVAAACLAFWRTLFGWAVRVWTFLNERVNLNTLTKRLQTMERAFASSDYSLLTDSRFVNYVESLRSFARAPLLGALGATGLKVGGHSEMLDALAGGGLLGAALMAGLCATLFWGAARPALRGATRPFTLLCYGALAAVALLSTVFYSREIGLMTALLPLCAAGVFSAGKESAGEG